MTSDAEKLWREACNLDEQGKLKEATRVYELAVAAGSADAMVNLAVIYEDRTSPPKSQEAVSLNERAAAAGHSIAAWNLHRHYEMLGQRAESDHWLKMAANLGDDDAIALMKDLGRLA